LDRAQPSLSGSERPIALRVNFFEQFAYYCVALRFTRHAPGKIDSQVAEIAECKTVVLPEMLRQSLGRLPICSHATEDRLFTADYLQIGRSGSTFGENIRDL